jgi:hypothetical protein
VLKDVFAPLTDGESKLGIQLRLDVRYFIQRLWLQFSFEKLFVAEAEAPGPELEQLGLGESLATLSSVVGYLVGVCK